MSMKDLLNKMSQLEALPAPKTRQVLNESSPAPVATTTKRSLKDVFNELSESIPAGAKPLPVMDPNNKQAGMGFLTSTNPAVADLLKTFDPKDVQIVQAPGQTNQQQTQQKSLQPMQASNQPNQTVQEEEFDEAHTGDEAEEKFKKYNAKELDYMLDRAAFKSKPGDAHKQKRAGQAKDAAYNLMIRKKSPYVAQPSDENLEEGAKVDRMVKHIEKSEKKSGKSKDEAQDIAWATANKRGMLDNKNKKKVKEGDIAPTNGIDTMGAGLGRGRSETTLEGKKPDFLDLDKDGNRKEPMKKAAVDKKKKAVNEAAGDTSDIGYELLDMAEEIKELARNAMRLVSGTAEEGRASSYWYPHIIMAVSEDHSYLGKSMFTMVDSAQRLIDGDDDEDDDFSTTTSESKKTKKKKVDESMNHGIQAARLEGKSHGLKGHAYAGKHADMEEARAYHEGYKEGLDELHGMDIRQAPVVSFLKREARVPATTRGMAQNSLDTPLDEMIDMDEMFSYKPDNSRPQDVLGRRRPGEIAKSPNEYVAMKKGEPGYYPDQYPLGKPKGMLPEDDLDEMGKAAYMKQQAIKTPGNTFKAFGQTMHDKDVLEGDFAFEAWDRQLNSLIKEGFSVSISKGEPNSPDSVNVNATDAEADMLLSLVKQAGMGIFGGDDGSDYGSPEVGGASEINSPGGIEVVDDHDGMLGLMKKLSGIEGPNADYEEEDCGCEECGNSPCGCDDEKIAEARCDECGMMESKCGGHDEALDEVQSPNQLELEVAEANAPDSGAANATNDTQGNAAANQALAKADAGQDIEDGMQDQSVQEEKDDDSWIWMDREEAEHSDEPAYARKERKIKAYYDNLEAELGPKALRSVKDEEPEEKENDVKESFTNLYKKLAMLSEESEQLDELSPELLQRAAAASVRGGRDYQAPKGDKFLSGKTYLYRGAGGGKPISIRTPDDAVRYLSMDDEVVGNDLWGQTSSASPTVVRDIPELANIIKTRDQVASFNKSKQDKFTQGAEKAMTRQVQAPPSSMSPAQQRQFKKMQADQASGMKEEEDDNVKESFTDLYKKLAMLSEESTAEKDEKAEKAGKKVTKDIEYDDKKDKKEKVDEWANNAGPGKTVSDTTFEQDIDFMTKVISGGLNKQKSTGQATVPVVASQLDRLTSHETTGINESVSDWKKLAGIK